MEAAMRRFRVDTALGPVWLGWTAAGLACVALPGSPACPGVDAVPSPWVASLAARLAAHLAGTPQDFSDVPLDTAGWPPFFAAARAAARRVPAGSVATYGDLARAAGRPGAARAAGRAMATNPVPLVVPCHRVVGAGGALGGFSGGGVDVKRRLLALEGASLPPPSVRP